MKKFIATAAITAAMSFSAPASAQTFSLDAILADIALQCGATVTLDACNSLVAAYIAQVATLPAAERAAAIGSIVVSATTALKSSAGTDGAVSPEIEQIIGSATTALDAVAASDPTAAAAVNSAVANVTVAVLEVVEERDLQDDAGAAVTVVGALGDLADSSTDNSQANAINDIAAIIEVGGSVADVIEEIEVISSNASPA